MATPDPDEWVGAQRTIVRMALSELRNFWGRIEHLDALGKRRALEGFWPHLIKRYGDVAATLAADRFEEITGRAAILAAPLPDEQANARMRYAVTPLFGGAGDEAALALLAQAGDELIKRPGRQTMLDSAQSHRLRVARVPTGSETCAWCLMLASRGFDYVSKDTAMAASHGGCDCRIALEDEDTPGYDPAALYAIYDAAANSVDGKWRTNPKAILAAMRERGGVSDAHQRG